MISGRSSEHRRCRTYHRESYNAVPSVDCQRSTLLGLPIVEDLGAAVVFKPPEIVGSGCVVKSLEAALLAFHDAKEFREAVLRAANLGGDADTTGAVCGQLAEAYWGESGIPTEWRDGLARPEMIEKAPRGLLAGQPPPDLTAVERR